MFLLGRVCPSAAAWGLSLRLLAQGLGPWQWAKGLTHCPSKNWGGGSYSNPR